MTQEQTVDDLAPNEQHAKDQKKVEQINNIIDEARPGDALSLLARFASMTIENLCHRAGDPDSAEPVCTVLNSRVRAAAELAREHGILNVEVPDATPPAQKTRELSDDEQEE